MRTGLACVVRNEANFIAEWIAYHILLGFDRLYIYNNGSTDETASIIQHAAMEASVTLVDWPENSLNFQNSAYTHAIANFGDELDWLGFIDADEFIYSPSGINVKDVLEKVPRGGHLALNWALFGSSGHEDAPQGLTIENYVFRASNNFGPNAHVKSFIRPKKGSIVKHCHRVLEEEDFYDPEGRLISWCGRGINQTTAPSPILRVNHYFTRSKSDWKMKISRGYRDIERGNEQFYLYDQNDILDEGAAYFGASLRNVFKFVDFALPARLKLDRTTTLPLDFDPDVYLRLHPDVALSGSDARMHYALHGRVEGRRYKPETTASGLFNVHV